jgi:hypothetical protein
MTDTPQTPDFEEMLIDIAEARGKATAAVSLQSAMAATLIRKGVLTLEEAADISAMSMTSLETIFRLPPDADEMAKSVLRGWAASIVSHLTTH